MGGKEGKGGGRVPVGQIYVTIYQQAAGTRNVEKYSSGSRLLGFGEGPGLKSRPEPIRETKQN